VYFNQRGKSRYAAFQAMQATVFQLVNFVIAIGLWMVWGLLYGLSMIPLIKLTESNIDASPPPLFWISLISMVVPLIYMTIVGLYGLWGALRTWQGKNFRYLLIGSWLEKLKFWKEYPPEA
jgi:hypothetical protein